MVTALILLLIMSFGEPEVLRPPRTEAKPLFDADVRPFGSFLARDGRRLLVAGGTKRGGDWKVLNLADGTCAVDGTAGEQRCWGAWGASLSDDGLLVAVGGSRNLLFVADAITGAPFWNLTHEGHRGAIMHLAFTPDGKRLVTCADDMTIRVWDVRGKNASAVFRFESTNPRLKLWTPAEAEKARRIVDLGGRYNYLGGIAISPDGKHLAVGGNLDGDIPILELATGKVARTIKMKRKYCANLQFTPDGKWLMVGRAPPKGSVEIWDLEKTELVTAFGEHEASVLHLTISPDKKTVLTGGTEDGFRVWDVATGKQKSSYFTDKDPRMPRVTPDALGVGLPHTDRAARSAGVAFLPDGKTFLIVPHFTLGKTEVYFHDTATGELVDFREVAKRLPGKKK